MVSLALALLGAIAYGGADFAGGLATRRAPVVLVTAAVQLAGFVVLLPIVPLAGGSPSAAAVGWGLGAAAAGTGGLLLYLRALAVGPMGVVAPLSAVVTAGLPLAVGLLRGERLSSFAVVAIGVALVAIVLATAGGAPASGARTGTLLALGAGVGFGFFFVGLAESPAGSGMWPLLAGRAASAPALFLLALAVRGRAGRPVPARGRFPLRLAVVSGVADTLANVFFLLAARLGALGISAVVVSLYPVVVALLAGTVLRERLTRLQLGGAGLALGASVLLALGG
jgi:drug/metabolite transporter (DMT)-like permease